METPNLRISKQIIPHKMLKDGKKDILKLANKVNQHISKAASNADKTIVNLDNKVITLMDKAENGLKGIFTKNNKNAQKRAKANSSSTAEKSQNTSSRESTKPITQKTGKQSTNPFHDENNNDTDDSDGQDSTQAENKHTEESKTQHSTKPLNEDHNNTDDTSNEQRSAQSEKSSENSEHPLEDTTRQSGRNPFNEEESEQDSGQESSTKTHSQHKNSTEDEENVSNKTDHHPQSKAETPSKLTTAQSREGSIYERIIPEKFPKLETSSVYKGNNTTPQEATFSEKIKQMAKGGINRVQLFVMIIVEMCRRLFTKPLKSNTSEKAAVKPSKEELKQLQQIQLRQIKNISESTAEVVEITTQLAKQSAIYHSNKCKGNQMAGLLLTLKKWQMEGKITKLHVEVIWSFAMACLPKSSQKNKMQLKAPSKIEINNAGIEIEQHMHNLRTEISDLSAMGQGYFFQTSGGYANDLKGKMEFLEANLAARLQTTAAGNLSNIVTFVSRPDGIVTKD